MLVSVCIEKQPMDLQHFNTRTILYVARAVKSARRIYTLGSVTEFSLDAPSSQESAHCLLVSACTVGGFTSRFWGS